MEKCATCKLRYTCKNKHWYDCQVDNYKYYMPDERAIDEAKRELNGSKQPKWKKGVDPMCAEIKKEIPNEKYIHVVMQDGKELVYLDRMHKVEFDGHWLTIMGGFIMDEIVFATHADNMQYMYVDE